jgi:manganese transport protein
MHSRARAMSAVTFAVAPPRPWRRYLALAGPGALVAVGYVDPGAWATQLAGAPRDAYAALAAVLTCGLVAILFQDMSARLGIATGRDLATLTREAYPRAAAILWAAAELTVIATELAAVLGSAVALKLLLDVPILAGVLLTALDVTLLFALERYGARPMEALVVMFLVVVAVGIGYEVALARPRIDDLASAPAEPETILAALGAAGVMAMPHNLYLHSSLVQATRERVRSRTEAARQATLDTVVSLGGATLLKCALVVLAATLFLGRANLGGIEDAHRLLLVGSAFAPMVFGLALLAAGQSATLTATLAGQVVMSGLLDLRWPLAQRRLVTRASALVPALILIALSGDASTGRMLVASQVVLSLALPFVLVPLMLLASDRVRMGPLANTRLVRIAGWAGVGLIVVTNGALVVSALR